jgi:hypothetical protein
MDKPEEDGLISLPDTRKSGQWSIENKELLFIAEKMIKNTSKVGKKIEKMQKLAKRNSYNLEVYQRVNEVVGFSPKILLALKRLDQASNDEERLIEKAKITQLESDFKELRMKVEETYAQTRIISKPEDYLLDQDHHHHLANQSKSFDWQFYSELLMFEEINKQIRWQQKKID